MKVAIFAEITSQQLDYLRNLAQDNGIEATFVVEGESQQQTQSVTPITGEMLEAVSAETGRSVIQLAVEASNLNVSTVEQALAHPRVPAEVKRVLEQYI